MLKNEPSMDQIDDYNGKESKEKKTTIKLVIFFLILVSILYAVIKLTFNQSTDYVGTKQHPGINNSKVH